MSNKKLGKPVKLAGKNDKIAQVQKRFISPKPFSWLVSVSQNTTEYSLIPSTSAASAADGNEKCERSYWGKAVKEKQQL